MQKKERKQGACANEDFLTFYNNRIFFRLMIFLSEKPSKRAHFAISYEFQGIL